MTTPTETSEEPFHIEDPSVMLGQDELMLRAIRKPTMTAGNLDRIRDAISAYVVERVKLDEKTTASQLMRVNETQNALKCALNTVKDVRVMLGRSLWEMPARESPSPDKRIAPSHPSSTTPVVLVPKLHPDQTHGPKVGSNAMAVTPGPSTRAAASKGGPKPDPKAKPGPKAGPSKTPTRQKTVGANELWKKFTAYGPAPKEPSTKWLVDLHDLIADMDETSQGKARKCLGLELWCQLVFLSMHHGHSRTLNKTKVSKTDISEWDLVPTVADEPCKMCGTKIACHWPNDQDQSKCRECHLQAKRCVSTKGEPSLKPRKRKRASESPTPRVCAKLECEESPIEGSSKGEVPEHATAVLKRPTLNLRNLGGVDESSVGKHVFPKRLTAPLTFHGSPSPPPDSTVAKLVAEPIPKPPLQRETDVDPADVERAAVEYGNMDYDKCKRELAVLKTELRCVLGNNQILRDTLHEEVKKELALLTAIREFHSGNLSSFDDVLKSFYC